MSEIDDRYVCDYCGEQSEKALAKGRHMRWNHSDELSNKAILNEIRRVGDEVKRTPTMEDMRGNGKISTSTVKERFGRWNVAIRKAGFEPVHQRHLSRDELIQEIRRLADDLGSPPTAEEMEYRGNHSCKTFQNAFGSWNEALQSAGFEPHSIKGISEVALLDEIERLVDEIGRVPTIGELSEYGRYSRRCYYDRFGGWVEAVKKAGYEPVWRATGENNVQWTGGQWSAYRGSNWEEKRRLALERDSFQCQSPGCVMDRKAHLEKFNQGLHVHHIVPRRQFYHEEKGYDYEQANNLDNLITLCTVHHVVWERCSPLCPDIR